MTSTEQGAAGTPFHMAIELEKVREFARATKSKNPAYLTDGNPVSPATFLVLP
jgi:hypothetical protein